MLVLNNIPGVLETFIEHLQRFLFVFFHVDHSFNRYKIYAFGYLLSWWLCVISFIALSLPIVRFFICIFQYFLACNLLLNIHVRFPKISAYALCILSLYFVFRTNQFLTSSINIISLPGPFTGVVPGFIGLIVLKS